MQTAALGLDANAIIKNPADDAWRAAALGGATCFDDVPQPFKPKRTPDEARRDKLHALTLFSTGCALRQKKVLPKALQQFQRAHQYDSSSTTIAEAVVEAAEELERSAERDRYLYRLFKLGGGDPIDVEELAFRTAMSGNLKRSIEIYERLLDSRKNAEKEPLDIVIHWRLAEVYYLADENKKAAICATWVIDALDHPQKFGLDAELTNRLVKGSHLPFALFGDFFLLADMPEQAKAMFPKSKRRHPRQGAAGIPARARRCTHETLRKSARAFAVLPRQGRKTPQQGLGTLPTAWNSARRARQKK